MLVEFRKGTLQHSIAPWGCMSTSGSMEEKLKKVKYDLGGLQTYVLKMV